MKFGLKSLIAVALIIFIGLSCQAQFRNINKNNRGKKLEENSNEKRKFDWNRVYVGGQLGGGLANGQLQGVISPEVGYFIMEDLLVAAGPTFEFFPAQFVSPGATGTARFLGAHAFARYNIFKGFFAHTEYEIVNVRVNGEKYINPISGETTNNINSLFAGAGLRIGNFVSAMILYNFLFDENNVIQNQRYSNPFGFNIQNPIIRVSFGGNIGGLF